MDGDIGGRALMCSLCAFVEAEAKSQNSTFDCPTNKGLRKVPAASQATHEVTICTNIHNSSEDWSTSCTEATGSSWALQYAAMAQGTELKPPALCTVQLGFLHAGQQSSCSGKSLRGRNFVRLGVACRNALASSPCTCKSHNIS